MIEIELKFLINQTQISDLSTKLVGIGFVLNKPRTYEISIMYDNERGTMQHTDGRIRLRRSVDRVELAYKKPLSREKIKKEIEDQIVVSSFEETQKILEAMGFFPTTSYERYRTEYVLDKTKITFDEYPFVSFIEIEGEEKDIVEWANQLDLKLANNLTDSCDTLFTKWRGQKGLSPKPHMKFDDYDR